MLSASKYKFRIGRAQVPPSGEETGRRNYIVAIGISQNATTLKSDTNSWGMYLTDGCAAGPAITSQQGGVIVAMGRGRMVSPNTAENNDFVSQFQ
ncbi:hypothetical protein TNCV_3339471 [Trichonephila clavipes]|nr:hypothetical protein TNCV_3339471 [Trichonephila clavipes]